jgi:hypothetical protein
VPYRLEHDKPAVALDLSDPSPCKGAAASGQSAAEQSAPGRLFEVDPLAGQPGTAHDAGEGCVHDYAAPNPAISFSASSRVDVGFLAAPYPQRPGLYGPCTTRACSSPNELSAEYRPSKPVKKLICGAGPLREGGGCGWRVESFLMVRLAAMIDSALHSQRDEVCDDQKWLPHNYLRMGTPIAVHVTVSPSNSVRVPRTCRTPLS